MIFKKCRFFVRDYGKLEHDVISTLERFWKSGKLSSCRFHVYLVKKLEMYRFGEAAKKNNKGMATNAFPPPSRLVAKGTFFSLKIA